MYKTSTDFKSVAAWLHGFDKKCFLFDIERIADKIFAIVVFIRPSLM